MDGCEMTHAEAGFPLLAGIPVMLVSSLSNPEDVVRAINAGADYYMIKPYDEDFFLSSVKAILEAPPRKGAGFSRKNLSFSSKENVYGKIPARTDPDPLFFHLSECPGAEPTAQKDPG
jgi:DNA-binding response OmpR family regulator